MSFTIAHQLKQALGAELKINTDLVFKGSNCTQAEDNWSLVYLGTILLRLIERMDNVVPLTKQAADEDDMVLAVYVSAPELGHAFDIEDEPEMFEVNFSNVEISDGTFVDVYLVLQPSDF